MGFTVRSFVIGSVAPEFLASSEDFVGGEVVPGNIECYSSEIVRVDK